MVGSAAECGGIAPIRMPNSLPKHTSKSSQTRSVGKRDNTPMHVSVGQPSTPNMLEQLVAVGIVIARNPPDSVNHRCELLVKGAARLLVAKKNDCRGLRTSSRLDDVPELAVRISAVENRAERRELLKSHWNLRNLLLQLLQDSTVSDAHDWFGQWNV